MRNSLNKVIMLFGLLIFSSGTTVAQSEQVWKSPHDSFGQSPCYAVDAEPTFNMDSLCSAIEYPAIFKRGDWEGKAVISARIDTDGNVKNAEIVKPSLKEWDEAVLKAVLKIKFTPAILDGKKIESTLIIPILHRWDKPCYNGIQ